MNAENNQFVFSGGCTCGAVRYQLASKPLFVHCCHCRWCQRETGAAFALNAMIEANRLTLLQGAPVAVSIPTNSGKGQKIWRCETCQIALWSNYSGAGDHIHFVRVGTLDEPELMPPDIHIFTESKQEWVEIPGTSLSYKRFYKYRECWPDESIQRRDELLAKNG